VPAAGVAELGSSKKPSVRVTIKGYTYRSAVASMGRRFILPIIAQVIEAFVRGVAVQQQAAVRDGHRVRQDRKPVSDASRKPSVLCKTAGSRSLVFSQLLVENPQLFGAHFELDLDATGTVQD